MPALHKWARLLMTAILGLVISGCGARVEQTIELNADGSGKVVIVGVDELKDIEEHVEGGLEAVRKALEAKVPPNWHLDVTSSGDRATFTVTTTFQDATELRQRLKDATGKDNAVEWTTTRTPFYQRDELQPSSPYQAWAKWAVDAVATLTNESAVESVTTYVRWPGRNRQAMYGRVANEERRSVESLGITLVWTPKGVTRTVDLRPAQDQTMFQSVNEWIKETVPTATVTESDGTYHISFTDTKSPWGTDLKVTQKRHNLFWNHIVVQEPAASVQQWLGPNVEVKQVTYHYNGGGWWSTDEQGPPKWYSWPFGSSSFTVDRSKPAMTWMVGYVPRTPLYVAWGLAPVLALGLAVGIPFGIKRTRKHWPKWSAALRGGMQVSTNVRPKFCSGCGQQILTGEPCACGEVAAAAGPEIQGHDAPPVGLWAQIAMHRAKRIFLMDPHTLDMPIQASVISIVARALILAFVFHRLVNTLFSQALNTIGRAIPFLGFLGAAEQTLPTFGWILLALMLSSGACLLVLYLRSGHSQLVNAAAVLSDAQWPVALGAVVAWVLSLVWLPLSIGAFMAGVSWGQAVLAVGLGRLKLSHQHRIGIQATLAFTTVLVTLMAVGMGAEKIFESLK